MQIVTGDTKVVAARQGRRLLHHHRRRRACWSAPVTLRRAPAPARRRGAGLRPDRRPRRHDHAGPRRARHRGRHRLRHRAAERPDRRRCSTPRRRACGCLRDATRGGVATILQRGRRRRRRRGRASTRTPSRSGPRCAAPASCSASTRCTSPARAGWSRSSRRSRADAALAALRAHPLGAGAAVIGRIADDPPGLVLLQDRVRRHPDRRPAGRRPAAPDLLTMHELSITQIVVDTIVAAARRRAGAPACGWRSGSCPGSCPDAVRFCFELVTAGTTLRGRRAGDRRAAGPGALPRLRRGVRAPPRCCRCAPAAAPTSRCSAGSELRIRDVEVA